MSDMSDADLLARGQAAHSRRIADLLVQEGDRAQRLSFSTCGLLLDFTRTNLSRDDLAALFAKARAQNLEGDIAALFAGAAINMTEDRAVMHMALRQPKRDFCAKGVPISDGVRAGQAATARFAADVAAGRICAKDGRPFKALLHLGIGGSDLGPRLIHEALAPLQGQDFQVRFAANVEPGELAAALAGLDPRETLILCVSKTFTTIETLENLKAARAWLTAAIGPNDSDHLVAISAAPQRTGALGFKPERVFDFSDWVGGRYSLWSAVSLSIEIALGSSVIDQLHVGAAAMDQMFETTPFEANPVIVAALIGWWTRTCLNHSTRAIIPYARRLRLLPQFLQQLEMESNGKSMGLNGRAVAHSGPVVWGAEGTNAQHAFFQHLHQSPDITPVEFVVVASDTYQAPIATRMTLANALAQAEALCHGKDLAAVRADMSAAGMDAATVDHIAPHRVFSGNRPSSFVAMDALSPFQLGAYLAFCEHRTFVEGRLWGINSFDQWGVELGKVIATEIDQDLQSSASPKRDATSTRLIAHLQDKL